MSDFDLALVLVGLIVFSAVFVYFVVWREPPATWRRNGHASARERGQEVPAGNVPEPGPDDRPARERSHA